MFEDSFVNEKYKGIKKGSPGMDFKNYANRIILLNNCDTFVKPPADYKEVSRLTVFESEIQQKKTVVKTKFLQFNDKSLLF